MRDNINSGVKIYSGSVTGSVDKRTGALQFYGLPFAEKPIQTRRLRPPVIHKIWKSGNNLNIEASKMQAGCVSGVEELILKTFGQDLTGEGREEDCLYMNIWAPNSIKDIKNVRKMKKK